MPEDHLGPDVDRSKISPQARITGASWLTGPRTEVGPGAVVHDSRVHDAVIEAGATVSDSIVVAEGEPRSHRCDTAGRTVVGGPEQSRVGADCEVVGSTLINVAVGARSRIADSWVRDATIGEDNRLTRAKVLLAGTRPRVTICGPTEVSEAYLGYGAVIDRRGYFEGIFGNAFRRLAFDEAAGRLRVVGIIELPHVSRYGINTINSTNSGKVRPQPGGAIGDLGPPVGLWHDTLLSHEPIELGPCCWVAPWTKVIGQSRRVHTTDEDLVNDPLATYLMPFAAAGVGGPATRGLVMPGELSVGFGPKQRRGAWVFTYAPGAVIAMVRRLFEALEPERKALADTIVVKAIESALAVTRAMAAERGVDLSLGPGRQRHGWPRWIGRTHALLRAHLEGDLWRFRDGEPIDWRRESGRWTHPAIGRILSLAPDALDKQVDEEEMFAFDDPVAPVRLAVPHGALGGTGGPPEVSPEARVAPDAVVGPGARIGPGCVVASGAVVWNTVLERAEVAEGARVERSHVAEARVGEGAEVRSSRIVRSALGARSTADAASVRDAHLSERTTVSAFADVRGVRARHAAILGGNVWGADLETFFMSMHLAGGAVHLRSVPLVVEDEGREVPVPAIPMLGGGSLVRGTAEAPVTMQGCFVGSNAVIEPNTHIGFGCFVQDRLGPDAGLLPFTLSTGPDERNQRIGGVLVALPSVVVTHFINWTYQAAGPEAAPAVALSIRRAIEEGVRAVRWELSRRSGSHPDVPEPPACYRSLARYSDRALEDGLRAYEAALSSAA